MKTLAIPEDLFDAIMEEAASTAQAPPAVIDRWRQAAQRTNGHTAPTADRKTRLKGFLDSGALRGINSVVYRLQAFFAYLHEEDEVAFLEATESVTGRRNRPYFASSKQELLKDSPTSNPKPIPGSNLWFISTTSTPQKEEMLRKVMWRMGYSDDEVRAAANALRGD